MTIHDILCRLQGVKPAGKDQWEAHCPCSQNHAHGDINSSLSVKYDAMTGKILLHCFTGCTVEDICGAIGCRTADLMPQPTAYEQRDNFLSWYAKQNGLTFENVYSYCYGNYSDGLAKIRFRKADGKKDFRWIKDDPTQKSGFRMTHEGCPHRLYVAGNLADDSVFMVEGEKDADNLHGITGGRTAVSVEDGAARNPGSKWREEYALQLKGKNVYILWDNDEIGRQFAEIEAQALAGHAAHIYMLDITTVWQDCPEKADISDMFVAMGLDETKKRITALLQNAVERPQTDEKRTDDKTPEQGQEPPQEAIQPRKTALQLFDEFMGKVQTEAYKPLETGMPAFDRLLGGGIVRQALVILTAAPGTGKTALASQVFEEMAKQEADVIFLNLEMSREQLLARSVSRICHRQGHKGISAADVLKGYSWKEDKTRRQYIQEAADEYRRTIAERMQYNPEGTGTTLDSIMNVLNAAGEDAKQAGKPAPVVILDYLHLITTDKREEQAEILKKAVAALKGYAIQYDTFVFAISANNRATNTSGIVSLDSGRDTSAIEYSADIQLSLNYAALAERRKKENGEYYRANNPDDMAELQAGDSNGNREMIVQVLKNRMNAPGRKLRLLFNPAASVFYEIDTRSHGGFMTYTGGTPFDDTEKMTI